MISLYIIICYVTCAIIKCLGACFEHILFCAGLLYLCTHTVPH